MRDLHRCKFSGNLNGHSILNGPAVDDGHTPFTVTQASYIFDISVNGDIETLDTTLNLTCDSSDIQPFTTQKAYTASVIAVLHRFGGINAIEELNGPCVHRLENIITLNSCLDIWFHRLQIWLERDPVVNYKFNFYKINPDVEIY